MRVLYSLLLYIVLPLVLLRLAYRSFRNPGYRQRIGERFGLISPAAAPDGIWVHAVSVGESVAAVKLVKRLQLEAPQTAFTVTCSTPTGSNIIQTQLGSSVYHVYLPYDLPGSVKRFLAKIQPKLGIIMEKELWPNLLHYAHQGGTRLMISNMLLSDHSFKRYQRFSSLTQQMLANIDVFAAQTVEDTRKIIQLGAPEDKVSVVGNLKYGYSEVNSSALANHVTYRQQLANNRLIWLAGSTHEGEDVLMLNAHEALLVTRPDLLLIIVPRHPERFSAVYQQCQARFKTQRRSELGAGAALNPATQVLLVDSMGELNQFIAISDVCFIGGSMVPVGGHNVLEVCHAGVPVIFGAFMQNSLDVAFAVVQAQAGFQVNNQATLIQALQRLLDSETTRTHMGQQGIDLVLRNQGALDKTVSLLQAWLK